MPAEIVGIWVSTDTKDELLLVSFAADGTYGQIRYEMNKGINR
jgi:hypothetical protein